MGLHSLLQDSFTLRSQKDLWNVLLAAATFSESTYIKSS
jgi:hypothetical protein